MSAIAGLTEGRIVHYVLPDGEHRPTIVVKVWREQQERYPGYSNLIVFRDGSNDDLVLCHRAKDTVPHSNCWLYGHHQHPVGHPNTLWATSVVYSAQPVPNTWHWPEQE